MARRRPPRRRVRRDAALAAFLSDGCRRDRFASWVAALRRAPGTAALGRAASPVLRRPQQGPAGVLGPGVPSARQPATSE